MGPEVEAPRLAPALVVGCGVELTAGFGAPNIDVVAGAVVVVVPEAAVVASGLAAPNKLLTGFDASVVAGVVVVAALAAGVPEPNRPPAGFAGSEVAVLVDGLFSAPNNELVWPCVEAAVVVGADGVAAPAPAKREGDGEAAAVVADVLALAAPKRALAGFGVVDSAGLAPKSEAVGGAELF